MNWTKEEIENSREIAKYFRKEIIKGDWYAIKGENFSKDALELLERRGMQLIELDDGQYTIHLRIEQVPLSPEQQTGGWDCFPLWTLTDCLEWLEEKGFLSIELWRQKRTQRWVCRWEDNNLRPNWVYSSTMTASAQKAVLEILIKKKK